MCRIGFFLVVLATAQHVHAKNVLLMISDNQSWYDVGCYGNDVVKTPNLDRLAGEGVRFRQAFATTASCGPSRAVIYSGLLTHSNGQYAHPHREHNQEIRPDVVTVFSMLRSSGYRTGMVGKDHIRPLEKYPIDFKPKGSSRDVVWMAAQADRFFREAGQQPFFFVVSFGDPHPTSIGTSLGVRSTHCRSTPCSVVLGQTTARADQRRSASERLTNSCTGHSWNSTIYNPIPGNPIILRQPETRRFVTSLIQ